MAWFSGKKKGGRVGVLGLLRRVVAATMGCFIGCFRVKEPHYHLVSTPKEKRATRNKNALSTLFLSDESDKDSDIEKGEGGNPLLEEVDFRELEQEAKFLKACGTLLETPAEIRKVPRKCAGIPNHKEELSNFDSSTLYSSTEKKSEKQPDESSTPVKICEELVPEADAFVGNPSCCMTAGHNTRRDSVGSTQNSDIQSAITPKDVSDNQTERSAISPVSSGALDTTVKRTNKSVRFECQSASSSEDYSQQSKKSQSSGNSSGSKPSPYPTPLKLTDEMQTPGTVYPVYRNNIAGRKTNRIRSQFVYSVLNPIEHGSHWKGLGGEKSDEAILITTPISGISKDDVPVGNYRKGELSLSHWLKPDSANQDEDANHEQLSPTFGEKVMYRITPGDRPILGIVASHWNDEEGTHSAPKWDGNGIPNTTTKYKEDQKVSWHATPFEERLEKALCEDTLISQRRCISGTPPLEFSEIKECDVSSSQAKSGAHLKSIVTF